MDWTEVIISPLPGKLESLCDRLTLLDYGAFSVEDEEEFRSFLENNRQCWDYVDEALDQSLRGLSRVRLYLPNDASLAEKLSDLEAAIDSWGKISGTSLVREEDWENSWKQYYKPIAIGRRLLICPQWETPGDENGRLVVRLDPGTIFGTGSHATTRLCLEALEETVTPSQQVLDLGCGSGILAIAALLLGAEKAVGIDIDPRGKGISSENARINGLGPERYEAVTGDVSAPELLARFSTEKSDIVTANIVADVILALAPVAPQLLKDGGTFICSGIIAHRAPEVQAALERLFSSVRVRSDQDWFAFICK